MGLDLKSARVLTVGYSNPAIDRGDKAAYPLENRATEMLNKLIACNVGVRPFFLIGHSMGGLHIKCMLKVACSRMDLQLREKDFIDNCRGVIFYGTPHLGAAAASLLHSLLGFGLFASDATINLQANTPLLTELHEFFLNFAARHPYLRTNILNFTERKTVIPFFQVVSNESSLLPDRYLNRPVNANHLDICKPESKEQETYRIVLDKLLEWRHQRNNFNNVSPLQKKQNHSSFLCRNPND